MTPPVQLVMLDLGNVLFKIDFRRTRNAFMALPGYNGTPVQFENDEQNPIFVSYDKGMLTTAEFYQALRDHFGFTASSDHISNAWNAIIVEPFWFAEQIPTELKHHYFSVQGSIPKVVLTSNISELHLETAQSMLPGLASLTPLNLDAAHYSCKAGLRKPDAEFFMHVCEEHGVHPSLVALYDDSPLNTAAAAALGIRTSLVTPGDRQLAFRELQ